MSIDYRKIDSGSPDKVKWKAVKYKKGDCFSIDCNNGNFLAAFITEKFNKYYDFTLIEYYNENEPKIEDFLHSKFFGNYFLAQDKYIWGVDKNMIECKYVDNTPELKKIGNINIIDEIEKGSYWYINNIAELLKHYSTWLPIYKNDSEEKNIAKTGPSLINIETILDSY